MVEMEEVLKLPGSYMLTRKLRLQTLKKMSERKTVPVVPHRRSRPSPVRRENPNTPKPGPKTVPVKPHRRTPPN